MSRWQLLLKTQLTKSVFNNFYCPAKSVAKYSRVVITDTPSWLSRIKMLWERKSVLYSPIKFISFKVYWVNVVLSFNLLSKIVSCKYKQFSDLMVTACVTMETNWEGNLKHKYQLTVPCLATNFQEFGSGLRKICAMWPCAHYFCGNPSPKLKACFKD